MMGMQRRFAIITALSFAVVASAIASVYARHEARQQFTELQRLNAERDELAVEWGRLQIEQSTWSTHARVESLARKKMGMRSPDSAEIVVVQK